MTDQPENEPAAPVASTTFPQDIQSVEETARQRSKTLDCCTSLLHQQPLETSENSSGSRASPSPDCYTNLLHQPSKRSSLPSSRSPRRRRANPPGLIVRGRVFHVRVRVPRRLEQQVGRTHVTRSLRTGVRSEAVRKARIAIADLEQAFLAMEGASVSEVLVADIPAAKPIGRRQATHSVAMTFGDLFRQFHADPAKVRAPKTQMIYDSLLTIVADVWGQDRALSSIDRAACRELLDVLRWLPSNPAKRFPNLTVVQAARMAKKTGLKTVLSAGSINGYMAKLRSLLTFAVNEGWIDRNPAKGLAVIDPVRRRDKRLPFSPEQLGLIFNAPIYRGCEDDEWNFAVAGPNHPRRGRFWVPLIALYSGMRLNEICQLDVADIRTVDGIHCFIITAGPDLPGNDKRLKTAASERLIPIHPVLLKIGLAAFVEERRAKGCRKLFPELPISNTGYYSDAFSKWFTRFLQKAGASRAKTCFHSFRHCYRDALREARVDHQIALALGGWTSGNGTEASETAASYGRGYRVETLFEAIRAIVYPSLDLTHLWMPVPPRPD